MMTTSHSISSKHGLGALTILAWAIIVVLGSPAAADDAPPFESKVDPSMLGPMGSDPADEPTGDDELAGTDDPASEDEPAVEHGDELLHQDDDGDGVLVDGDGTGIPGDHACQEGEVVGCDDNCPHVPNPDQADMDGDGLGDACDPDMDGDGVPEDGDGSGIVGDAPCHAGETVGCDDSCPLEHDPTQADGDGDGVGDACEQDMDGDGVADDFDCAPLDASIHYGAHELCDGVDQDCDGLVDEGFGVCDDLPAPPGLPSPPTDTTEGGDETSQGEEPSPDDTTPPEEIEVPSDEPTEDPESDQVDEPTEEPVVEEPVEETPDDPTDLPGDEPQDPADDDLELEGAEVALSPWLAEAPATVEHAAMAGLAAVVDGSVTEDQAPSLSAVVPWPQEGEATPWAGEGYGVSGDEMNVDEIGSGEGWHYTGGCTAGADPTSSSALLVLMAVLLLALTRRRYQR